MEWVGHYHQITHKNKIKQEHIRLKMKTRTHALANYAKKIYIWEQKPETNIETQQFVGNENNLQTK